MGHCGQLGYHYWYNRVQLYFDYEHDIEQIEKEFFLIKKSHLPMLIKNVWIAPNDQIQTQINGLAHLSDMEYVAISFEGQVKWKSGELRSRHRIRRVYPLFFNYEDKDIEIGTLLVEASIDNIIDRLLRKLMIVLISNAAKTFIVAGFILFLFYKMVAQQLTKIAKFTNEANPSKILEQLQLDRKLRDDSGKDELDEVVQSINSNQKSIASLISDAQKSEKKYRSLFNDTLDMIHIVDENGRITDANQSELETMGYTKEEYLGKPLLEIIHPDFITQTETAMKRIFSREGIRCYETTLISKLGKKIKVEVSAVPQKQDENIVGARSILRDIRDRKRIEEELEEHRSHLEELVKERTAELEEKNAELEHMNNVFVGREVRIKELRDRVKELELTIDNPAFAGDMWVTAFLIQEHGINKITMIEEPFVSREGAFAVKKGNTALLREIDAGIKKLKKDGTLTRIKNKWKGKEIIFFTKKKFQEKLYTGVILALSIIVVLLIIFILTAKTTSCGRGQS